MGLRLGYTLCRPHSCQHCRAEVDHLATHGLSCRKSEERHYRHVAVNDILYRTLASAYIPSRLAPSDLNRSDGKRPDGVTMIPWKNSRLLVWDATCPDTLAQSYRCHATSSTGAVATLAEVRKSHKYSFFVPSHSFTPVAIESLGPIGRKMLARVRLLTTSSKVSGSWLHALPISSLGLRMDDNTITVTVGLRLGSTMCRPHSFQHCGAEVDHLATHGLSCRKSEGRHYRHVAVNDILYRTLASVHIPSRLEPSDLNRSNGMRPDGVTMIPWKNGRLLVWDATCPDTLAPSYRCHATSSTGAVATLAEERKSHKYSFLVPSHSFTPVAIESLGPIGRKTLAFLK